MAKNVIIILLLVDFLSFVTSVPQIFTESYAFCEFKFSGKKKITFPNKLWTIDTSDFILHFSLCGSVQEACKNATSSCLFPKTSNKMIDLGHEFSSAGSDDTILVSQNGAKCHNSDQNYTLSISFVCSASIKPKPRLLAQDEENGCNFEVTMMRPDCQPRCTENVQGSSLIDIRNFPKNIQVHSDSKHFSLSLCGSNKNCSADISACEIQPDGSTTPLASIESQLLIYDQSKGELKARGRFNERGELKIVQVLIKCNWETEAANPVYKKGPSQGKWYKFEIQSSYGCVKLPYDCRLSSIDNFNYDLRSLYTLHGWAVGGVPRGKIFINICGPLKQPPNRCSAQHSQVCHVTDNDYINRGSILSLFEAQNDSLRARFVFGSTCRENTSRTYSTEIEFKCSKTEKGPQFKDTKNCVMFLQWETPKACPLDYYKSQNCYVSDRVSNRNLKNLHTHTDRIYPLSASNDAKLIYNLCGPIHESCNNHKNVSFCLKTAQRESVIGWDTREVISEKERLFMQFSGENGGEIFVNLICSYQNPSPVPDLHTEDSRRYNLTVFTPLACIAQGVFPECVYHSGNITYDLTPLVSKNKNYVIPGDGETEFIFNVCGPIITAPGALCRGSTMFCKHNKTALNIKHQYASLGGVSRPRLLNNTLILEAPMGEFCREVGYYKSVMHFKCSQTNVLPRFVSKDSCVYNFIWETPQACPQTRNCTVGGPQPGLIFDLTKIKNKVVRFDIDGISNKYEFDLCKDVYTNLNKTNRLRRYYSIVNGIAFIILDLNKKCSKATPLTKIIFKLECSETNNEHFEQTAFKNCVLNITLKTRTTCHESTTIKEHNLVVQKFETNCTIFNGNTGYEFNLINLKSEDILQKFQINLDQSSVCDGIFCKNGSRVVPQVCPIVSFNYSSQIVKLEYSGVVCGRSKYEFEVLLKCNQTKTNACIIEDAECKSVISYNLPEACLLLKQEIVASTPTAAIAGGVTTLLVVVALIIAIYFCKRSRHLPYLNIPLYSSKTSVPIYCRDATE
ncbi:cation-independent mannose-6-phosphate receptor-like isoform X2 [Tribolium madens]|uniref:cation-independent mannose-6-phosphate receptor-like isoform X2 n=1 Tax=Tribolium madens TaxID=41895 RepID=UPI001CF741B1|nr:cation-independent mannose-6-phosphate receptor-like isoform X2 [Tribolium madens]